LMPRNFGFESRPLRDEPTPFLCAIALTPEKEAHQWSAPPAISRG
jgi:hypothetical protein